jgi:hypothetical protein
MTGDLNCHIDNASFLLRIFPDHLTTAGILVGGVWLEDENGEKVRFEYSFVWPYIH